ncbi:pentapeptide repeat-containing protein [Streptomyces sp. NBC_00019]|uniref:pentapeptide repeat-containing protein n=1 Tax=Streptomyces sp. NBC_00019 TaxID=2975623 RepID=UPI003256585F
MRLRWDWLGPVVQAPYVPTIGPVHPSVLTEALFTDTLIAACTDRWFLRLRQGHPLVGQQGRDRPHGGDRLTDGELPEIRATATDPADTLAHMTTPLTARQRLAALHSYAAVNGEDFTGQNLASARTSRLRFTRCSFIGADLRHATLDGCWFKFCDFSDADLRGASLRGVSLAGCDLRGADLRETDLTGARFGSVNTGVPPLGLTYVTGARFEGASLLNVQADGVIGWPPGHGANE